MAKQACFWSSFNHRWMKALRGWNRLNEALAVTTMSAAQQLESSARALLSGWMVEAKRTSLASGKQVPKR